MKKNKKVILIIVIVLVVITILYFVFFHKKGAVLKATINDAIPSKKTTKKEEVNNAKVINVSAFPLKIGSKGGEVANLQMYLNKLVIPPYAQLAVDGNFGANTSTLLYACSGLKEVDEETYNNMMHDLTSVDTSGVFTMPLLSWKFDSSKIPV